MNSTDIVSHAFEGVQVRALTIGNEPWFILNDVCAALDILNVGNVIARLDADETSSIRLPDGTPGNPNRSIINEAGLYSVILRSDKPEAKAFKRWVTHEVLPSIRRTGAYVAESPEQLMARALVQAQQTLEQSTARIAELEPRAEAWNAIASAEGDYSVGDAAKILARAGIPTGPTRLFNQLRDIRWIFRGADGAWRAYADRVETGHLAEKPQFHYHPASGERVLDAPQVRVTVKGLDRLRVRLHTGALKAVGA